MNRGRDGGFCFERQYVRTDFGGLPVLPRDSIQAAPDVGENRDAVGRSLGRDFVRAQHARPDGATFDEGHLSVGDSRADGDALGGGVGSQPFGESDGLKARIEYCKASVTCWAVVFLAGVEGLEHSFGSKRERLGEFSLLVRILRRILDDVP